MDIQPHGEGLNEGLDQRASFEGTDVYRHLGEAAKASEAAEEAEWIRVEAVVDRVLATEQLVIPSGQRPQEEVINNRLALRAEGAAAARSIIGRLHDFYSTYHQDYFNPERNGLERMLGFCATSESSADLARLFEVAPPSDKLTNVAARVGGPELLPVLDQQVADEVAIGFNSGDEEVPKNALKIVTAMRRRTNDPDQIAALDKKRSELEEAYAMLYGYDLLDDEKEYLWREAEPAFLGMRYGRELYDYTPKDDDDFIGRRASIKRAAPPKDDRLRTVRNLFALTEQPLDDEAAEPQPGQQRMLEALAYLEEDASPYAVSMGIEVEVYRSSVLPPRADREQWTPENYADFMAVRYAEYHKSHAAGIPEGGDGLWEFVHEPVRHYLTLSREVQALMRLNLVNPDYPKHALHLTIGGVTSQGLLGLEAMVLARSLEATGWSTTGARILGPERTGKYLWDHKGEAGIKERRTGELELGSAQGVEIRTLQLQSLSGLDRTLRATYGLGAALQAYQSGGRAYRLGPDADDEPSQALAATWSDFSERANDLFQQHGMGRPSEQPWQTVRSVLEPTDKPETIGRWLGTSFLRLGALLTEAESDPDSAGAKFQDAMQRLVVEAQGKAMAVLDRTRPSKAAQSN